MEKLLWSIALPGFGQLLNKKYVKGIIFIFLEFLVNAQANFNEVIIFSFQGNIQAAIEQTNYPWLMFYPCLYFFAMWDAYKDAMDETSPYLFLPFVFSAYFVTVGLIYSSKMTIFGALIGPVWLPILFVLPGVFTGYVIRWIVLTFIRK
ncbi:hypothetical protein NC797_09050 [Aquibacillus sp. 3ASR75-11]|uniref:Uncharacterized protein n=1 Tax=Terrihalobacillus insolitus TaxID=2950438 RepID=A0A9X3WUU9_9BACI|nr:hypothetical protein [Terrihalobacillus insolitus]MDC3413587.1 hypothetical protein [Terrihalobacillus insolitus]MDC3424656.1 hypothetical protein [Terrihalobacillus insolitus]